MKPRVLVSQEADAIQRRFASHDFEVIPMPYTADVALVVPGRNTAVIVDPRPEVARWFEGLGITTIRLPADTVFEPRDCRWSHDGRHLWIGFNRITTTQRGAEAVTNALRLAGLDDIVVHTVHVLGGARLDTCFCPLPSGRVLWVAGSFIPAGRAEVIRNFGSYAMRDIPLTYVGVCSSVPLDATTLLVPKLGYRSWLMGHLGQRFEEVNLSGLEPFVGPAALVIRL